MLASSAFSRQPAIFGEVLFDCFPDGRNVLGGAPFNVAWHLQGLGCPPRFISRIGNDELGKQVISEMQRWGMDTAGLQQDASLPTGRVKIIMTGTAHQFDIMSDQAYDHIRPEGIQAGAASPLLYHGSLILRGDESARTLAQLKKPGTPVFLDINLRAPWYPPDMETLLRGATWLKLNDEEFHQIASGTGDINQQQLETLRHRYALQTVIVTCGARGAWWCDAASCIFYPAPTVEAFIDSVGAGDAFAAVVILGLLQNWPPDKIMRRARRFAARICGIQGATTNDRLLYTMTVMSWSDDD